MIRMKKTQKEISREEAKVIMLDMLKEISSFCDKHNIRYYLAAGTLIGAIRHKGFIPWDDDIDIEIPRPDYNRFIELYRKEGKYSVCAPLEKNSIYFYAKVYDDQTVKYERGVDYTRFQPLGIDIDIFPTDGQPDRANERRFIRQVKRRRILLKMLSHAISPLNENLSIKSRILRIICHILSKDVICRLYIRSATRYSFDKSPMVGFITPYEGYDLGHRHRREVYSDRVKVQFEDGEYWAPIGYDEYLRDVYGDYMQLPPVEKRVTHHSAIEFWKEKE